LSLNLINQLINTTQRRLMGEWKHSFTILDLGQLDGSEWSASRPGRFSPEEIAPSAHCIRGWVDSRASLDAVENRKNFCPLRESNPNRPAHSPSLYQLSYPGSPRSSVQSILKVGWKAMLQKLYHLVCHKIKNRKNTETKEDNEQFHFLRYTTVYSVGSQPMMSPQSSGSKNKPIKKLA
jgi:hypothetical protein